MKKTVLAIATSAVLAAATLAPTSAQAYCRGCGIGAGIIGGMILGGAIASARPYYYAEPAPVYVAPRRACYADREFWSPRYQAYVVRQVRVPCY
jgi:hypothetical protein